MRLPQRADLEQDFWAWLDQWQGGLRKSRVRAHPMRTTSGTVTIRREHEKRETPGQPEFTVMRGPHGLDVKVYHDGRETGGSWVVYLHHGSGKADPPRLAVFDKKPVPGRSTKLPRQTAHHSYVFNSKDAALRVALSPDLLRGNEFTDAYKATHIGSAYYIGVDYSKLRKAVTIPQAREGGVLVVLRKAHFSAQEMKQLGLRWVTARPGGQGTKGVPIIVKDLGEDEAMVVGGAGGELNYVRFRKPAGGLKKIGKKPKDQTPLSEEETTELEKQKGEAGAARQQKQTELEQTIRERLGEKYGELTAQERRRIALQARQRAEKMGASEQEAKQLEEGAISEQEKAVAEAAKKSAAQVARAALDALAREEATGQPQDSEVQVTDASGEVRKIRLSAEDAQEIAAKVFELRRARGEERAVARALRRGDAKVQRAVELLTQPLSEEEVRRLALADHVDREQVKTNVQLAELADPDQPLAANAMQAGAVDAGAGMAAEVSGETILRPETAQRLGVTGSARVIAHYLRGKHDPKKMAKAIQQFIATTGGATAAMAVAKSEELQGQAEKIRAMGGAGGLLTQRQATAKALEATNEAKRICARALGGLETMAQVALMLEQGVGGNLALTARSTRLGAVAQAEELGLDRGDYAITQGAAGKYVVNVKEEALDKLASPQPLEQWEGDKEIQEIKVRGRGEGWEDWKPEGQGEGIILSAHQQADIKFWERQKSILVGDEAGSGKTAVALCGIAHLAKQGKVKKALVVVPKSVLQQFGKEAAVFLDPETANNYVTISAEKMSGSQRRKAYAGDQLFTVVTHDTLRNDGLFIQEAGFDAIVVDEAHYLTQREGGKPSQRSEVLRELQPPYRMMMTGTPVKNDLSELWSMVEYLQPGLLGSQKEFMARYGKLGQTVGPMDTSLLHALQQKLDGAMIGIKMTTKHTEGGREVLEIAPEKRGGNPIRLRQDEKRVKLTERQAADYRAIEQNFLKMKHEAALPKGAALNKESDQRRIVNNISPEDNRKVGAVKEIMAAHPDEKVIIFATNDYAIETVKAGLGLPENAYGMINGSVGSGKRSALADQMTTDPNLKVLFCTDAANFGMNIQGASVVVNFDTPDTQATVEQRVARSFRRKQTRDVTLYHVRSETPLELTAAQRLKRKKASMSVADSLSMADETGLAGTLYELLQAQEVAE